MTITSRPYTGNAAGGFSGPYSAQDWRTTWFQLFGNSDLATNSDGDAGILLGVGEELVVRADSPASANVIVNTGAALIAGMWVYNDADVTVAVPANATGSNRLDIIYIQYDSTAGIYTASIGIATGTVNLPTLTQNLAAVYQIPLAYLVVPNGFTTIAATDIFDWRVTANATKRVKVLVQNVSGSAMNAGDAVVWSTSTSQAVTTTTSALDPIAGFVEHYIPNNGYGYIVTQGVAPVKITGTVARGDRLSHTTSVGTVATLASLTTAAIALQPSTSAVNSRILANVAITPQTEIQTTQGDLLVRNNANEIVRRAAPTNGYPLVGDSTQATGYKVGNMLPLAINRTGFRLRRSSNLAISEATPTDITWQVENWDTDGFIAVSATTVTIPAGMSGTWHLWCILNVIQGGGASRVDAVVEVKVNGSTVQTVNRENIGSSMGASIEFSFPLALAATDTIKITLTMTSSGGTAASRTLVGSATTSLWAMNYLGQSV